MKKQYKTVQDVVGPLAIIKIPEGAGIKLEELVELQTADSDVTRLGKVLEISTNQAVVQMFEGTSGLATEGTKATFLAEPLELGLSKDMIGRIFDGMGRPLDGLPENGEQP